MFLLTFLNPLSQYLVLTERPLKMRFFPQIARVRQFRLTRALTSPVTCLHDGSWFDQRVVWSSVLARSSSSTLTLKKLTAAVHAAGEQRTQVDVVINMGEKDNPFEQELMTKTVGTLHFPVSPECKMHNSESSISVAKAGLRAQPKATRTGASSLILRSRHWSSCLATQDDLFEAKSYEDEDALEDDSFI